MIKNIIFDVDGVLRNLTNSPLLEILSERVKEKIPDEFKNMTTSDFYRKFCKHSYPPYLDYDKGLITENEFIGSLNKDFGVDKDFAKEVFEYRCRPDMQIFYEPTFKLAKKLKSEGYKLYILSNMGKSLTNTLRKLMDITLFDGIAFSSEVHHMKPHKDIYEHAISMFNISPDESIFVDDREDNLEPFKGLGGHTFLFDYKNLNETIIKLEKFIKSEI